MRRRASFGHRSRRKQVCRGSDRTSDGNHVVSLSGEVRAGLQLPEGPVSRSHEAGAIVCV